MNDDDRDLREAFGRLRESESRLVPPFRIAAPPRPAFRLAFVAAMLVLLIAVGYFTRSRHQERRNTTSISNWRAPTDFLLRTPGRELIDSVPQLKPQIPGGHS
jgi:hypothetical protein